ncbi:MAG: multicopper oxidase domain-containing protein, partial [Kiritimatiellae bacterium]|nr:multicopper oxidase domain-containing protein [Kiritimatiellia bacterium]
MRRTPVIRLLLTDMLGVSLLTAGVGRGAQMDVYLRAGTNWLTMADGRSVMVWGFARDSGANVEDGTVTVPGPSLKLTPDDQSLVIHVKNDLPEPVSVVIPGQSSPQGNPERNPDGRVRSFTHEAPPGGTAVYTWPN